ncbi:MAG: amidohydrolase family protein [Longimicrobiales bacterium]|nr:amidohydrolase family protein [Longimicrobiales bacterium]
MERAKMVIDFHAHYPADEPDFPARLVRRMDRAGIDRICLFSAGPEFGHADNLRVLEAATAHPDRIFAFALVRLGSDVPEDVDRFVEMGFRGFKVTNPVSPYDDPDHFPLYDRMEASGLPLLAHTGIVMRTARPEGRLVNADWMRPIRLDVVLRSFPGLNVVGAHLGAPWHEEASMMARMHPNYYVDLTGAAWGGWRANKDLDFYRYHFFWENAWDKVVFGTDILALDELIPAKEYHDDIIRRLDLPTAVVDRIYGGTAARLLKL